MLGVHVRTRGQEKRHRRLIKEKRKTRVNCVVFGMAIVVKVVAVEAVEATAAVAVAVTMDGGGGGINGCAFAISLPKTPFPTLPSCPAKIKQ